MKELVIVSGKGGTGKTTITASLACLASNAVMADCDVDAADLHLVLNPDIQQTTMFISGHQAVIRPGDCSGCGLCRELCRFEAILVTAEGTFSVDHAGCEGCGVCVAFCPEKAIDFPDRHCGEWYLSDTRFGPMVHARLGVAAENSGKLVSLVRKEARRRADETGRDLVLVDGPPGVGCPVIASITGANAVLAVTEPTLSGAHDLERVIQLARHFTVPVWVCVNKWDINPEMTESIETTARNLGASLAGRVPYDPETTAAQIAGQCLMERSPGPASEAVARIWNVLEKGLSELNP